MYYKASGKIPFPSIIICTLAVLATAPLLAIIYTYAVWYIPIIYVNFLLTLGAGFGLYMVIHLMGHQFKSRSKLFGIFLSVLGGVLLSYTNWAIWIDLVLNSGETYGVDNHIGITVSSSSAERVFSLFLHPNDMLIYAKEINKYGTWGIKSSTVSGVFLSIIWLIEAGILIGFAPFVSLFADTEPFDEAGNEWAEKKEVQHAFQFIEDIGEIKSNLENRKYETIMNLPIKDESTLNYSKVFVYYMQTSEIFYMSVKNFVGKIDKDNKLEYTESFVAKTIEIPKELGLQMLLK